MQPSQVLTLSRFSCLVLWLEFSLFLSLHTANVVADNSHINGNSNNSVPSSSGRCFLFLTNGINLSTGVCPDLMGHSEDDADGEDSSAGLGEGHGSKSWMSSLMQVVAEVLRTDNQNVDLVIVEVRPCGDSTAAVRELMTALTTRSVHGVITALDRASSEAVGHVTGSLRMSTVQLVTGDIVTSSPVHGNHVIIPHYGYNQIQNFMELARHLNWTSFVIGTSSASYTEDKRVEILQQLAFQQDICALPYGISGSIPTLILDNFLLTSSHHHLLTTPSPAVVFVSQESEELESSSVDTLSLTFTNRLWHDVFPNLEQSCQRNFTEYSPLTTALWRKLNVLCTHVSHLNQSQSYDLTLNGGNLLLAFSLLLSRSKNESSSLFCNSTYFSNDVLCKLLNEENYELKDGILTPKTIDFDQIYFKRFKDSMKQRIYLDENDKKVKEVYDKDCGEFCHLCANCFPHKRSTKDILLSQQSQPFKLVGLFPLHSKDCRNLDLDGTTQALTFLNWIDRHNNKTDSFKIQGVVIDTCDSQITIDSLIHDVSNCMYSFPVPYGRDSKGPHSTTLQPNLILGHYIQMPSDFSSPRVWKEPSNVINMDKSGLSSYRNIHYVFIEKLKDVLLALKWTFVNVITSEEEKFNAMAQVLSASRQSNGFCVVNSLIFKNMTEFGNDFSRSLLKASQQTLVFVFLTSREDTQAMLDYLSNSKLVPKDNRFKFVFTPWNSNLADMTSVSSLTDVNVVLQPSITQTAFPSNRNHLDIKNSVSSFYYPELFNVFQMANTTLDKAIERNIRNIQILQSSLSSFINDIDLSAHTSFNNRHESTALDVYVKYADRAIWQNIGNAGESLRTGDIQLPSFDRCLSWCPSCHGCRGDNIPDVPYFYTSGNVIITGLFPLHDKGDKIFQCGKIKDNQSLGMSLAFAFITAIDSFKQEYPNILGNLTIGGLLLDTCSDASMTAKMISDFESCRLDFESEKDTGVSFSEQNLDYNQSPNPAENVGYFIVGDKRQSEPLDTAINDFVKEKFYKINSDFRENDNIAVTIVKSIKRLGWNDALIIIEDRELYYTLAQDTLEASHQENLCIVFQKAIKSGNEWEVETFLDGYLRHPVILVAQSSFADSLFKWLGDKSVDNFWIIFGYPEDWLEWRHAAASVPSGTLFVSTSAVTDQDTSLDAGKLLDSNTANNSSWSKAFWEFRHRCELSSSSDKPCSSISYAIKDPGTSLSASSLTRMVYGLIHKIGKEHIEQCENETGPCDILDPGVLQPLRLGAVSFDYRGERVTYDEEGQLHQTHHIYVRQSVGFVKIGSSFMGEFHLNVTQLVMAFHESNLLFPNISRIVCIQCKCLKNFNLNKVDSDLHSYNYHAEQGNFIDEIWTKVIISVSCFGAFFCVCLLIYVVYKVCRKAIGKRYVGLGLFLLVSLAGLYLSVIPYTLTSSETICGLRYLLPEIAFALSFAGVLAKLMSIQNHKIIGLGGEVSIINQFLTLLFIVGIQIAISVNQWYYSTPTLKSTLDSFNVTQYACNFSRFDFCLNHVYNFILLLISTFYAGAVRKEKRNMGEAKLLLISCCLCVLIWCAAPMCLFLLDGFYVDKVICVAVLACACLICFVVFIPKLRMVAGLKYSVSHRGNPREPNDYHVDSDFLYERPFTLPGTLTNGFSNMNMNTHNFIKSSMSPVDFDLNY